MKVSMLRECKLTLAVKAGTETRAGEGQHPLAAVLKAAVVLHGVSGVLPGLAGGGAVRGKRPPQ